jgi:hypothetical protein
MVLGCITPHVGYYDNDLTGDIDMSKSTSGVLFFLGNCLVSWQSLKQRVVALSSYEAKYIAAISAATQALWLARILWPIIELRVDSKSALTLAKNSVFHERSNHIRIKYHFIRGCLEEGNVKASYIRIEDQLTDSLTKSLGQVKFHEL